ncbi:hypothetical protein, partial [Desulfobacter sp.]|uniref:hypothetical protein n=1 Tax=Desulfobacter sp. TaxID=2294 RepID=UPI003D122CF9
IPDRREIIKIEIELSGSLQVLLRCTQLIIFHLQLKLMHLKFMNHLADFSADKPVGSANDGIIL